MFGHANYHNLRRYFADQFEPNAAGYLYRQGMKGAPIQVSAAERDAFVAQFDRRMRWGRIGGTAMLLSVIVLVVILTQGTAPEWWGSAAGGVAAAFMLAGYWWIRNAPARALERRPAVGLPRDRVQMERVNLARMSYSLFAAGFAGCAVVIYLTLAEGRLLAGWHPIALASAAAIILLLARQLLRKIRYARA